jgi:DNA-binding transcriptional LysR family regulator
MNQFETFVTVVESGSYSAAAKLLYRSPSAISKQITALEESLNVLMFDRTTRNISITEAGQVYYEHCKDISARIKNAESETKSTSGEPAGTIKITWPNGFAYSKVMKAMAKFSRSYPQIKFEVVSSSDVLNLTDKSIDIAFRSSPKVDSGLVGIELFTVSPMVCASPDFVERHGYASSLNDLADMPNILPSYMNLAQKIRGTFPQIDRLKLDEQHRANDIVSIHSMVREGLGAAFLFKHIIHDDLESGRLVNLLPDLPIPELPVYLIHHQLNHMPKRLRVFIDFFKAYFLYPDEAKAKSEEA